MTAGTVPVGASAPAGYAWEPTDEEIADRYGVPVDRVLRFDLNTAPATPQLAAEVMTRGGFDTPLCEYPPADYRRLVEAAADAYGVEPSEVLVGAGADEILDLAGKAFLSPGGAAVIPAPTYSMYRVITEQRGARAISVPRRRLDGWSLDVEAMAAAAIGAELVWLCNPNNPTAHSEPDGAIEMLLGRLEHAALRAGTRPPAVVLDEAYAEFAGRSLLELRARHPNLVVARTASKAYGLAGLRVGFAIASPATISAITPWRPPASVSVVSAAIVTEALRDGRAMRDTVARIGLERPRLAGALRTLGWAVGPSVTNFLLVDFGTVERAAAVAQALLRRGLVPRAFGVDHALAASLRFTIRDPAGNDRLLAAAAEIRS